MSDCAQLYSHSKNHWEGRKKLSTFKRPSDYCQIHEKCGSCAFINKPYDKSLQKKNRQGVEIIKEHVDCERATILPPQRSPMPKGYRNTIKLAIRKAPPPRGPVGFKRRLSGLSQRFQLGLFQPGSHDIVDIRSCPLHNKSISNLLKSLCWSLNNSKLEPWCEKTRTGDLQYVVIRSSYPKGDLMVSFIISRPSARPELRLILKELQKQHPIASVYTNVKTTNDNNIWGETPPKLLLGQKHLTHELCNLRLTTGPKTFFQVNPGTASLLYSRIESFIGKSHQSTSPIWDLYCGSGQIGLLLAKNGHQVLGIEESPFSIEDALQNRQKNDLSLQQIHFSRSSVEEALEDLSSYPSHLKNPHTIIVNPSRKGMTPEVCDHLVSRKQKRSDTTLIYVSCDIQTLARDLGRLSENGYTLRQLEAFDMFSQTDKLEWLAVLN